MPASNPDSLVVNNLDLVQIIARLVHRRLPRRIELDDIESAGRIGLMDAARKFDPTKGFKFRTYAMRRVRGAMQDWIRESSGFFDSRMVSRAKKSGFATPGVKQFGVVRGEGRYEGEAVVRADARASQPFEDIDDRDTFAGMLRGLDKKSRTVLTLHYREGLSLRESGQAVGFSESRASQILSASLKLLRAKLTPAVA